MINHIGIESNCKNKDISFYQTNFAFDIDIAFKLPKEIAVAVFKYDGEMEVVRLKKDNFYLELFINTYFKHNQFQHFCLEIESISRQIKIFKDNHINYYYIERPNNRKLLFVNDFSKNLIELYEK